MYIQKTFEGFLNAIGILPSDQETGKNLYNRLVNGEMKDRQFNNKTFQTMGGGHYDVIFTCNNVKWEATKTIVNNDTTYSVTMMSAPGHQMVLNISDKLAKKIYDLVSN